MNIFENTMIYNSGFRLSAFIFNLCFEVNVVPSSESGLYFEKHIPVFKKIISKKYWPENNFRIE
jgi:hypothetical protein